MMHKAKAIVESSRLVVFEPNYPQTWWALKRLINFLQDKAWQTQAVASASNFGMSVGIPNPYSQSMAKPPR